jgi:hypothetical protein
MKRRKIGMTIIVAGAIWTAYAMIYTNQFMKVIVCNLQMPVSLSIFVILPFVYGLIMCSLVARFIYIPIVIVAAAPLAANLGWALYYGSAKHFWDMGKPFMYMPEVTFALAGASIVILVMKRRLTSRCS